MNTMEVANAKYLSGYKVLIRFSDKTEKEIDFEPFLNHNPHPQYDKYRQISRFRKFKVERGNIVWGKDWDLIFPVQELYEGKVRY